MDGIKSEGINSLSKDIWNWCCYKNIWISAAHIPWKCICNPADIESRVFNDNVEWMLDSNVFLQLAKLWGKPTMDLFASRLNCQISKFASWKPDPDAVVIDAFSIPWSNEYYYMFPPFSLITRCVQKIINDQSECLIILPLWPTQIWYPFNTKTSSVATQTKIIIYSSDRQISSITKSNAPDSMSTIRRNYVKHVDYQEKLRQ